MAAVSVITCSIDHIKCELALKSVKETIGVEFETIVFDNREKQWGLCRVYNHCAERARFPFLCFMHEDAVMGTRNWGGTMTEFMRKTPNCGVIGFAGGVTAERNFFGWGGFNEGGRYRIYDPQHIKGEGNSVNDLTLKYNNPDNEDFAKAVTLDGVFLFTDFDTWRQNKFDENNFPGFHCYDADFSFSAAQGKQNYVCLCADLYHYSSGPRGRNFYLSVRVFQRKWKDKLPRTLGNRKVSLAREIDRAFTLFKLSVKSGLSFRSCVFHVVKINGLLFAFLLFNVTLYRFIKKFLNRLYDSENLKAC